MMDIPLASPEAGADRPPPPSTTVWSSLRRDPLFLTALAFLVVVVVAAVFAGLLAPYDPLRNDLRNALQGPSAEHLLGTDELGRDVLSRILFGARLSLSASAISIGVALVLGFPLGLYAGFRGGPVESIALRVGDGVMALPGLIVILAVLTVVGNGLTPAMIALGFVLFPTFLRLTRGIAQSVRTEPYIDAARTLGLPKLRIMRRHVLPHVLPALIVHTSLMLGVALLVEAGLSYVGLGTQPPEASWGAMLAKAQTSIRQDAFIVFPPGLAITFTVLALNLVGDGLRDAVGRVEITTTSRRRRRTAPSVSPAAADGERLPSMSPASNGRPPAALEIASLSVAFPQGGDLVRVIDGISLHVRAGEVVGLVGESGCGKTIAALAAIGLVPEPGGVVAGSVRVLGTEIVGRRDRQIRRLRGSTVAMVFQDPSSSLDPSKTVGDQIGESLRIHRGLSRRRARARAIKLLERVGIGQPSERVGAFPHEFSGGMAQRVAIASALACDPRVLIADEPTTALDVTVQREILDLLRDLQRERELAVLFVTHDLGIVADLCQRAVVMYAGQVVETGSVEQLFARPQHPYTEALLAAVPDPVHRGGRLPTISGVVPAPGAWPRGCRFAERCTHFTPECAVDEIVLCETGAARSVRCIHPVRPRREIIA